MNNLTMAASVMYGDLFFAFLVIKLVIGILAIVYIVNFYISWWKTKNRLSVISFYTINKIVKKSKPLTIGLVFLVLSFIIEFLLVVGWLDISWYLWAGAAQLLAIIFIAYTFYETMRKDIPSAVITEKNVQVLPSSALPSKVLREVNKKEGFYDERYIKKKLAEIPVPEKILKKLKTTTSSGKTTKTKKTKMKKSKTKKKTSRSTKSKKQKSPSKTKRKHKSTNIKKSKR